MHNRLATTGWLKNMVRGLARDGKARMDGSLPVRNSTLRTGLLDTAPGPKQGWTRSAYWIAMAVVLLGGLAFAWRTPAPGLPGPSRELAIGTRLPALTLADDLGITTTLGVIDHRATIVLVIRSALCASCRRQLDQLIAYTRDAAPDRHRIVAISKDPPEINRELKREAKISFPVLSDEKAVAGNILCGGRSHCMLLVDRQGVIRWGVLSDNWRKIPSVDQIVAVAESLQ